MGNSINPYVVLTTVKDKSASEYNINPSTRVIGPSAFQDCSSFSSINIPASVVSIGNRAFGFCYNMSSVVFFGNDSLLYIDTGAFYLCNNLISFTLPDSVKSIGYEAFAICSRLESIVIGKNVVSIDQYAFDACGELKYIYYRGSAEEWSAIDIAKNNSYLEKATVSYNHVA